MKFLELVFKAALFVSLFVALSQAAVSEDVKLGKIKAFTNYNPSLFLNG